MMEKSEPWKDKRVKVYLDLLISNYPCKRVTCRSKHKDPKELYYYFANSIKGCWGMRDFFSVFKSYGFSLGSIFSWLAEKVFLDHFRVGHSSQSKFYVLVTNIQLAVFDIETAPRNRS